jgi:hypothetical protein
MAKGKPMVQQPRPSTVKGHPGGPAGNNPPRPGATPPPPPSPKR